MSDTDRDEPATTHTFARVTATRSLRSASLPFRATACGAKGFQIDLTGHADTAHIAAVVLRAMTRVCALGGAQTRTLTLCFGRAIDPGAARLYVIEYPGAGGVATASATIEQGEHTAVTALATFSVDEAGTDVFDDVSAGDAAVHPPDRGGWMTLPGGRVDEVALAAGAAAPSPPQAEVLHGTHAGDALVLTVTFAPVARDEGARVLARWRVRGVSGGVYHEDGELFSESGRLLARSLLTGRCQAHAASGREAA